ncbi:MAG: hypothetical protein IPM99_27825 [Rubrivivax sp.]|nr:hypothetical protein [Rubrivivax sp.]
MLIQPLVQYPGSRLTTAGEAWQQVRNNLILPYGAALLAIISAGTGAVPLAQGAAGRPPARHRAPVALRPSRRAAHWANAIAFVALAVSGIVMAWGQMISCCRCSAALFRLVELRAKNLHNSAGPMFAVSLLIVIGTFVRDNLPRRGDLGWLLRAAGCWASTKLPHAVQCGREAAVLGWQ